MATILLIISLNLFYYFCPSSNLTPSVCLLVHQVKRFGAPPQQVIATLSETEDQEDKFSSMPKRSQQTSCHWEQSERTRPSDLNLRRNLCAVFLYISCVVSHQIYLAERLSEQEHRSENKRYVCAHFIFELTMPLHHCMCISQTLILAPT